MLGRQTAVSARALAVALGVSIPTLHRMLAGRFAAAGLLAAEDGRISAGFRAVCTANGKRLKDAATQA